MGKRYQVVVVGGGPVGVGLAVDLALRGIRCAVVEQRAELSTIPKGQGLSQRTMEHFHFWGVADELRAARAMSKDHPIGQVTAYESLMGEFWHAPAGREVIRPYYFQANERLPQYRTEKVLRRLLGELDVDDRFGWTATDVEHDADGARVTVRRGGADEVLHADYVVGCDGGHSLVRSAADIERSGTDFDQVMALIVFRSPELSQALHRFPQRSTYRVLHPDLHGYWMFFGRVDSEEEFFFHAPVPPAADVATFDFTELLHRAAGFPFACQIEHTGLWDLRVQVAQDYRRGRAFIAGDAAHTHPPYGGFGLNNGLEDAVNLSWKLAAALEGWGGEGLLDSYTLERRAVFRDIGENVIAAGIRWERDFLERHSPQRDGEEFRRIFADLANGFGRQVRGFEPHYEGSPVVFGPPGGVSGARGAHAFTARAGHHLPPQPLSTGRNVYEELGKGFTLLALGAEDAAVRAFEHAARAQRAPLRVVRDAAGEARQAYGCSLVLVRPDQYVAWAGDTAPEAAEAVLRTVCGRAPREA